MSSSNIEFLYQSISDAQATIRGTDVKIGFLFVVAFIPILAFKEIFSVFSVISDSSNVL